MALEATLICLDNSEWMRNGDYTPSRLEAQQDAAIVISNYKTQRNDNTVGVMTYAGKTPEVIVSPTTDMSKILAALHSVKIKGESKFETCLQIGQLVLKHRQNKNQQQRIIIFVASPIQEEEQDLVKLGKKLKKNNVAVDVISFGEDQRAKLDAFISAVNSGDNSHLLTVPPGPHILSDVIITSPILGLDSSSTGASFEFGVNPNEDPELALALRISMEEDRQRREKQAEEERKKNEPTSSTSASTSTDVNMEEAPKTVRIGKDMEIDEEAMMEFEEEALLRQAIAMSQGQLVEEEEDEEDDEEEDEEEQLKRALQLSEASQLTDLDPQFLANVLGTLPGVDRNDPRIQSTIQNLADPKKEDKKDEKDEKDKEKK